MNSFLIIRYLSDGSVPGGRKFGQFLKDFCRNVRQFLNFVIRFLRAVRTGRGMSREILRQGYEKNSLYIIVCRRGFARVGGGIGPEQKFQAGAVGGDT